MARTFPRTLLAADVKSRAEERAFEALRGGLGDGWEVFHSAGLIVRDPGEGAKDDECDFVLCHPDRGIVLLEVKGGDLECRHGEWYRAGERIPDPFGQALDHRYNLQRKIDEVDGWRGRDLFLVHALWFPDITAHRLVLAPDAPPEIVLDRHDLEDVEGAVDRVLAYHAGARERRRDPGPAGATMLRELLAPEVRIRVPMAAAFSDEEQELVHLTAEQAALLGKLARNRRLAVFGCAGSGKTMMAVERAKRMAADGKDVLFVCFNKALAAHLRHAERRSGINFTTFHSLCFHWARKAKVALPEHDGDPPPEYWDEELPAALMEAMATRGGQYDAVFADEAQDLHNDWLDALVETLRDPGEGSVWLFLDDNQRIYDQTLRVPGEYVRWDLTVNCRNTQAIHREVMKLYEGEIAPEVKGPPGRDVELVQTEDQPGTVAGVLERLCGREEVPPQDVVVLSSHAAAKSDVARQRAGRFAFTDERGRHGDHVHFSSIRAFKGLESPVVVLCELEDLDDLSRDRQLYVGLSRAKNHCVVVAPPAPGG